jgi:hypothetical protein
MAAQLPLSAGVVQQPPRHQPLSPLEIRERTFGLLKALHPEELESLQWDEYTGTTVEKSKKMIEEIRRSMEGKQDHRKVYKILQHVDNYCKIVDVAIQHLPQITALVWAGIRMGFQVCTLFFISTLHWRRHIS